MPAQSWIGVGERVREARLATSHTQQDVATALNIDRSAVARIEAGTRQITALELFALADLLSVPVGHFVASPTPSMVSRRRPITEDADSVTRSRFRLDVELETQARDLSWLTEHGFLEALPGMVVGYGPVADDLQARELAAEARGRLGVGEGPLGSMLDVCAAFGMHLRVAAGHEAGASLILDQGLAAAVVGGADEPGRRRATAAHELGHVLLNDEYTSDLGVAASRDEREQVMDAFAAEFLLPTTVVVRAWTGGTEGRSDRQRLIRLAGEYRVSWTTVVRTACAAGVIDGAAARRLQSVVPTRGDFLQAWGQAPEPDLVKGVSRQWQAAVLEAYTDEAITSRRAVELLHGDLTVDELPQLADPFTG
ncbi:MAG: XRE family transcriptional regulator [Kineosporiaceae bacterium]